MKRAFAFLVFALALPSVFAVGWRNLDAEHRVEGRKVSGGYLTGKVVLVCRDVALAENVEEVWGSFKTKPFVALGAFTNATKVASYPVYANGGLAENEPTNAIYIVDFTGKILFRGQSLQRATEIIVSAITNYSVPRNAKQWWRYMNFEATNMPAHALLRLRDRKSYPKNLDLKDERLKALEQELKALPDIDRCVELVSLSGKVKDMRAFDPKKRQRQRDKVVSLIEKAGERYAALVDSSDPRLAQEAKNALADLAWAKAVL